MTEEPKECRDGQHKHHQTIIHRVVKSLLVNVLHPKIRLPNHRDRVIAREDSPLRDNERIHYRTRAANSNHSFWTLPPWLRF